MKGRRFSFSGLAALLYILMGGVWVLLSDPILLAISKSPEQLAAIQSFSDWFFLGATALILFILLRNEGNNRKIAEQDYKNIFDNSVTGFFQSLPEGKFLTVNPAMARIYGYESPEEMITLVNNINTKLHLNSENRQRFVDKLVQNGSVEKFEAQNFCKDGSIIWTSTNARIVYDASGNIHHFEGFVEDITQRKRVEESLRESEWSFRGLYENNPLMLFTLDTKGRILTVNQTVPELLGYSIEELIGHSILDLTPDEDKPKLQEEIKKYGQETGSISRAEFRKIRKDGSILWVRETIRAFEQAQDTLILFIVCEDITNEKQAEIELSLAEQRYRALVEQLPAAVYREEYLKENSHTYLSPQIEKILGYSIDELNSQPELWRLSIHPDDLEKVIQENIRTDQTLEPHQVEYRAIKKDGSVIWLQDQAVVIRDENGIPLYWQGLLIDITERKKIEAAVIQSEERFSKVFQASPIAICVTTLDQGIYIDANPAYLELVEYKREELIGRTVIEFGFISADERIEFNKRLTKEKSIKGDQEILLTKSGGILNVVAFYEMTILNGQDCVLSLFYDVTEQKKVQESLLKSELSYRGLFNTVTDAIYIQDENGIFLDVNEGAIKMYGYSREELVGKSPADVSAPDKNDVEEIQKKINLAQQGEAQQFEFWGQRKNGEVFPKHVRVSRGSYFGKEVLIAFAEDITERKKVEEALRTAEARYRNLVEHMPAVVYIDDATPEATTIYISPQIETLMGYASTEWMADKKLWSKSLHPDDRQAVLEELVRSHEAKEPFSQEYRLLRNDGQVIWIFDHAVLLRDQNGKPLYYQGVLLDTTKQRLAEEAIRQSEERFSKVFASSSIAICITTLEEGRFIDANQAYWNLSGLKPENTLGRRALELNFWKNAEERSNLLEQLQKEKSLRGIEEEFVTASGNIRNTLVFYELMRIGDQDCILAMFHDTTEQKLAQDDLRRKEAILNAIAFAADQFLKAPHWAYKISPILEKLGTAAEASRVYIFQKISRDNQQIIVSQIFEWCAPEISPQINNSALQNYNLTEFANGKWADILQAGNPVCGALSGFSESEQRELANQNILSIICMPIMIEKEFWGYIGLDDCLSERTWSKSDIEALRTASNIISAAIQREESGNAVDRQLKELMMLHAVALANSTASDMDELVTRVTEIIYDTLAPDNCGILLLDQNRQHILPHKSYMGNIFYDLDNPLFAGQGISSRVVSTGRSVRIGNIGTDPDFVALSPDSHSGLCLPILSGGQVIGVINIEKKVEDAFSEADERLLNTIAGGMGTAMEKFKLFEAEQRRAIEAESLMEATSALTRSLNLATLLDDILILVNKFAPYDSASVELVENNSIKIAAGRGIPHELIGRVYFVDRTRWGLENTRLPIIIPDVTLDSRFEKLEGTEYIRSWMGIPLYAQNKLIGFINLDRKVVNAFSHNDAQLMQTFGNQAAIAIENARLFDLEQRRRREAETLREATSAVASTLDQGKAIQSILEQLAKVVPYHSASVQILGDGYLEIVGGTGWLETFSIIGMRFPVPGENPNSTVIQEKRSYILQNAPSQFKTFHEEPHSHIHSWMGVPLIVRDKVIGMLAVDHMQPNFYSQEDARLAENFANQAAIAIENARIYQEEKNRTQIIEALADIANEFATTQELGPLLDKVAQRALELLRASHVAIYLVQSDNKTVKVVSAKGSYSNELISHTIEIGRGITGGIIAAGKPEIVNDTRRDPRTIIVPGTPIDDGKLETMMCTPLILRGQSIGAINAWRLRTDGYFNESELNFLISIAHQTSISIEMSRLFQETRRRAQEAAALAEVGRDVSATLELDVVLERIAAYAKDMLNAETSAVYLSTQTDSKLYAIAVYGEDAEEVKNDPLQPGNGIAGTIASSKRGEIVNYAASDPRAVTIKGTAVNPAEHIMGVPVMTKDQLTGLLVVWRTGLENEFKPVELDFLGSLAQQAAVAIQNARLFAAEQNQRQREASMLDLMRLTASSLDLDEINQTILGHIVKLIPADSGSIQLLKGSRMLVSAVIGLEPEIIQRGNTLLLDDFPLNYEIVTEKHPIRIDNVLEDDRYRWLPGITDLRSFLAVPIIFKGNVIGMATLDSRKIGHFTKEDEDLALAIANNAANAIGNARLFELEQRRRQEAENLRVAAAAITSTLDARQVLETILIALKQVVPYYSATMFLIEDDLVKIAAAEGLPDLENALNRTFPADNKLFLAIQENNRQPVILYDAQVDPRFERWAAADNVHGWMGVPLVTRGEIVGYITLDSNAVGTFDENSAALVQTFAFQAAVAIDNARLYEETRRRLDELEVVSRVSFALRAMQEPEKMMPMLLKEVLKIIGTDTASIWLYNSTTNELEQVIASGWQEQLNVKHISSNEAIVGHIYQSGEVHLIDEFPSDPFAHPSLVSNIGVGWGGVGVPIRTTSQTIGVMIVALPIPRKVETHQVQLLTTLAEIAGNAIHRAQLYKQSEEQVRRLTALRDVDTAISSSFDLRVTLNILLDHTLAQLNGDAAAVIFYNPELHTLTHVASLGFYQASNIQAPIRISNRLLNEAILERRDIFVENISAEPNHYRKEIASQEKFVGYYATPLVSKGQVKGILEVYLRQPFSPDNNWVDFFHTLAGQAAIAIDNAQLFDNLQRSNQELSLAYDTTLEGWGKALELRDKETQGHTIRVTDLTLRLARRMGIPEAELIHVRRGVLLHDIGKMAVPDNILKKTGPLNEDEWNEMRQHPQYAYDLLYPITYLRPVLDIPYSHHEHWDGQGYPRGIKGEEIPLAARIFAVVDVWDALLYDRPYRDAWPKEKVAEYLLSEAGTHFDPTIVNEFLRMIAEDESKTG